ncbi:unnamed protein product [Sphenostylis stenocarpa]|uniref:ABC transporter domain-containing protein n=1 Tax=Sphenostylis stenocarpa TaxID=92480 RepID=A0AA86RYP7_9FABA|nr:unnamed protein product [Sphenostylis stenocarpa]
MTNALKPPIGLRFLLPPPQLSSASTSFKFPTIQLPRINCSQSSFEVREVSYQPPEWKWKNNPVAGISKPTSGSIYIQKYGNDGSPSQPPEPLVPERVGIVFQFPERYFVADNVLEEVTFGWPRQKGNHHLRENLALGLQRAINWVGLSGISLDKNPHSLSGGYKRRLALAIQLVQTPDLLILDEPLAGLGMKMQLVTSNSIYFAITVNELIDYFFPLKEGGTWNNNSEVVAL